MYYFGDFNFKRGYEWWLMKEVKKVRENMYMYVVKL